MAANCIRAEPSVPSAAGEASITLPQLALATPPQQQVLFSPCQHSSWLPKAKGCEPLSIHLGYRTPHHHSTVWMLLQPQLHYYRAIDTDGGLYTPLLLAEEEDWYIDGTG